MLILLVQILEAALLFLAPIKQIENGVEVNSVDYALYQVVF